MKYEKIIVMIKLKVDNNFYPNYDFIHALIVIFTRTELGHPKKGENYSHDIYHE